MTRKASTQVRKCSDTSFLGLITYADGLLGVVILPSFLAVR